LGGVSGDDGGRARSMHNWTYAYYGFWPLTRTVLTLFGSNIFFCAYGVGRQT
jgi:hypothetical protein